MTTTITLIAIITRTLAIIIPCAFIAAYLIYALLRVKNPSEQMEEVDSSSAQTGAKKHPNPIQLNIQNTTDETKTISLFELFNDNPEGVIITPSQTTINLKFLRRFLAKYSIKTSLIRLRSSGLAGKQREKVLYTVCAHANGQMLTIPAIMPFRDMSPYQFQQTILDIEYELDIDAVSLDIMFDICPKTSMTITMFPKMAQNTDIFESSEPIMYKEPSVPPANTEHLNRIACVIVENKSDVEKEIELFNLEKYTIEYVNDEKISIESGFNLNILTPSIKSDDYITTLKQIESMGDAANGFNSIRIYAVSGHTVNQVNQPLVFSKSGNKYCALNVEGNENAFQRNTIDINLPEKEVISAENTCKVKVLPNTRVLYYFTKHENITPNIALNSMVMSDSNNTDSIKQIDIDIASCEHAYKAIKFNFTNIMPMERPICIAINGKPETYYPLAYIDTRTFDAGNICIPVDINVGDSINITIELPPGEKISTIFLEEFPSAVLSFAYTAQPISISPKVTGEGTVLNPYNFIPSATEIPSKLDMAKSRKNWFPIWVNNSTEEKTVVYLPNNMVDLQDEYKIKDGVYVSVKSVQDWPTFTEFAKRCPTYKSLSLKRIYSQNTAQATQTINYIENSEINMVPIASYLSATQFQSNIIDIATIDSPNGLPFLSLAKNPDGTLKDKATTYFEILPKTRVCFFVEVEMDLI